MYKSLVQKYRILILVISFIIYVVFLIFKPKGIFYNPITTPMESIYTMKINKIEQLDTTNISLDEVLLDINEIYIKSHIWGKDKLVAVEVKKDPTDKSPLCAFTDLWIGGKFKFLNSSKGYLKLSIKDTKIVSPSNSKTKVKVISPLYLNFYFNNGKNILFKIEDNTKVQNATKILTINKTLKFHTNKKEPLCLKFGHLIKGITYTKLNINTNYYPKDIKITLLTDSKELKSTREGYGGGVIGTIYFDPIEDSSLKIKIKNTKTNEEKLIPIKIN